MLNRLPFPLHSFVVSEGHIQCEEQIINCNMPDSDDGVAYENQDEEAVAMIEEPPSGV